MDWDEKMEKLYTLLKERRDIRDRDVKHVLGVMEKNQLQEGKNHLHTIYLLYVIYTSFLYFF